jgi:hypothetical protein
MMRWGIRSTCSASKSNYLALADVGVLIIVTINYDISNIGNLHSDKCPAVAFF